MNQRSFLCALVLAACAVMWLQNARAEDSMAQPAAAPVFELRDQDGNMVKLADFAGKVVVLEWFNPGCPFVQRHYGDEHRTMVRLADKYRAQGVVWLAINSTYTADAATNAQAARQWQIPYPVLDDSSGQVGHAYGARTTPHMFVIDPRGQIVYQGAIDDDPRGDKGAQAANYVDQALQAVLAGQLPDPARTKPYGCSVKYQ